MVDPQVVAAIVTAAGALAGKLFDRSDTHAKSEETSTKAEEVIDTVYAKLKAELTENSVRVLRTLLGGDNMTPSEIRRNLYPELGHDFPNAHLVDSELDYRLRYLSLLGLLTPVAGGREYAITPLGQEFVYSAQRRKDYHRVLFKP